MSHVGGITLSYDDSRYVPLPPFPKQNNPFPRGLGGRYPYEPEPENNPAPAERIHNNLFLVLQQSISPPQFRMGTRLHTRANSPISPHKQKRNENLTPLHTPLPSPLSLPIPDDFHPISGPMIDPGTWDMMKRTNRQTNKQKQTTRLPPVFAPLGHDQRYAPPTDR